MARGRLDSSAGRAPRKGASAGRRRRWAFAAAWTLFALGACASEHPAPYDCDVDPANRPLGRKILPFLAWVGSRPAATVAEIRERDAMLAEDGQAFLARRGEEMRDTGQDLRAAMHAIGPEFVDRSASMADYLESQGDRLREDTHCFLARAWHALKLVE